MNKLLLVAALIVPALAGAQLPGGTVSGQLLTPEGRPAVAVRVSAMAVPEAGAPGNSATALVSIAMTDNEGHYRLENVLPGRYYIMAGFVDLPSYYPGVAATSGANIVNVLSGTPVTGINFAIANTVGVTVSGRVRRATGTGGVGGQRLGLLGGNSPIQEVSTTADGSFQIQRVRPGSYQLLSAGARSSPGLSVVVGDKDVTGLELVIVPTVEVTGNVVVEGKGPAPRVQLQLAPFKGNGGNFGMSTAPDGSLRATLPEGSYRISWSSLPVGYEIKSITAGSVDLLSTPLRVSADAPPERIRAVLAVEGNPWVRVSGRVTNAGSTRTLTLTGPNVDQIPLTINPDGTFEIPQALPGTYQIRPTTPVVSSTASFASPFISVVIPNQDTTSLIIPLPPTKDVPGIVVNTTGAGVQGRFSLNYSQRSGTSSSSGGRTMVTQSDGRFTLQIPEGSEMRLTVNVSGYSVKSVTYGKTDLVRDPLRVTADDVAEIRVELDTTSTTIAAGVTGAGGGVSAGVFATLAAPPPLPPQPPQQPVSPTPSSAAINQVSEALSQSNLITSPAQQAGSQDPKPLLALGMAPEFSLKNVLGGNIDSAKLKGKVVVVEFWAPWAVPSKEAVPEYNKLLRDLKDQGLEVVAVTYESGSVQEVASVVSQLKIEYPVVMGTQEVDVGFGGHPGYPTTFLIGRDWKVYRRIFGRSANKFANLESDIRSLLAK